MGKKNHKKAIRSLMKRIYEHQEKIRIEYETEHPDEGLIRHWETEIRAFEKGIEQGASRFCKNITQSNDSARVSPPLKTANVQNWDAPIEQAYKRLGR